MARETCPWTEETALARRHDLSASTVMQKSSPLLCGSTRPSAMSSLALNPRDSPSGPRCSSMSSALNRSWPAGTGV